MPDSMYRDDLFATRLSAAVAERGLTLHRIQAHLQAEGIQVSLATLSYWTTGRSRPLRARSVHAVRALERVLEVTPGWLEEAVTATPARQPVGRLLGREEMLRRAVEEHGLNTPGSWDELMVHHLAHVDATGAETHFETRTLRRAAKHGARSWALVIDSEGCGPITPTGDGLAPLLREIVVDDALTIFEFGLAEPLQRGEWLWTHHELDLAEPRQPGLSTGYAAKEPLQHLVLEVVFTQRVPSEARYHPPCPEDGPVPAAQPVPVRGNTAQVVVAGAPGGLHRLAWSW